MNGTRTEGKSGNNEEQIKNAFNSMDISNKTPEYYNEFLKSYEERNNNKISENKNIRERIRERVFNINEGILPNISDISNIEGSYYDSLFLSNFNEFLKQDNLNGTFKINSKEENKKSEDKKNIDKSNEEEDESKDIYYNDINELSKSIKALIKIYMNLLKKIYKDKKLNEKEKKIMKISEQNNKNNQYGIEIKKLDISNKGLEDGKQKEEDSKGKYDLILSAQKKELKNALKKKEEMETKNRCNIKRISTKLKEKLKNKQTEETIFKESDIIDKEQSEKIKIINKFKEKIKYINLKERNNQKSKELNNKKNELEQKDENSSLLSDEIKQLRNENSILENGNNEQKNQIMTLRENTKENLDMKKEIQNINNKLSNFATKSEINILNLKLDEILNFQRNIRKEMQEPKSQKQNNSDNNDNHSII